MLASNEFLGRLARPGYWSVVIGVILCVLSAIVEADEVWLRFEISSTMAFAKPYQDGLGVAVRRAQVLCFN